MQLPPAIAAAIEVGDTVIASTPRSARALGRLHGEAQRSQGLEAWQAPDILDWDSWLSRLWQRCLRSGGETRLLLTPLQEQQIWVRLVKPTIEGRRLISVSGVAELAQQAYALLCAYRALDFLRGERLGGPDVESFREWARGFERTCRNEDYLSRSLMPLVLHDAILAGHAEATRKLLLIGFDRITPAQQYLVEAFEEKGHQVEIAQPSEVSTTQTPLLVKAADKRDEILTCALWVRNELAAGAGQGAADRIAVVVPGVSRVRPEIESVFRQILAPQAVAIGAQDLPLPFEFSLGVPLSQVPMARAALLLLRWMNHAVLQEQVSWLVLSGFLCADQGELLPIAVFDAKLRSQFMRQPEQELDTFLQLLSTGWKEAAPLDALQHRLRIARKVLPQDGSMNFSEWVTVAERILEAVHWPGAHRMQSEDFQVESRWSQLLDSVAALAFDGHKVGYGEFLEVLEEQAGQTIFAPESRNAAVQILGPLEAAGLTFEALWFLGADDASWPAVGRPQPFLTASLQRKHGMPHAESAADWKLAQQVTLRLQNSAAKSVFSYPAQNAEGACRPSTLVSSGASEMSAQSLRVSFAADESADQLTALLAEEEPAAIVPWPMEQDAGGAEVLKRQAACAFQSFATRRLAARPMEATDWGLEPRERGSVVHKILEELWAALKSHGGLIQARSEDRLQAIVENHVAAALQRYGNAPHTRKRNWSQAYLAAEQVRICSLIDEWLEYEAKRAPFTVEAGEVKLPATVGNLKLQMRVDRIDALRAGRVIIDYKTGVVKTEAWEGERPDEPQLPLYAGFGRVEDLRGVLLGRIREGEAKFIGRVQNADDVSGDSKLSKPPYRAEMLHAWQRVLLDVGEQFLRGEAQVDPKRYPKTCEFCPLPGLCRIAETERANGNDDEDDGGSD